MPQIQTVSTTTYKFSELSESGKRSAIEKQYNINVDYEWWESDYDDFKNIGKIIGINIDKIYFSGFSCQGDGACFEGKYEYKKGSCKELKNYAPLDTELHRIAEELFQLQRKNFYRLGATVKQSGHYYHSGCTDIDVYSDEYQAWCYDNPEVERDIKELLKDFMDWIYKSLNNQYDFLTGKEAIQETIEANDYDFTEDGKIY